MNAYRTRKSGFTLVEILIVVIILGILAAIVIPQFTNASQDARKSSLTSQLQTIRSQVELYKLQHLDKTPTGLDTAGTTAAATAWAEMTVKTDVDQNVNPAGQFGPYLQAAPINPLNNSADVFVVAADPVLTNGTGPSGATGGEGWIFNRVNGKTWATAKNPAVIYNESNPADPAND